MEDRLQTDPIYSVSGQSQASGGPWADISESSPGARNRLHQTLHMHLYFLSICNSDNSLILYIT